MSFYQIVASVLILSTNVGIILFAYFKYLRYLEPRQGYTYSISLILILCITDFRIAISHLKDIDSLTPQYKEQFVYKKKKKSSIKFEVTQINHFNGANYAQIGNLIAQKPAFISGLLEEQRTSNDAIQLASITIPNEEHTNKKSIDNREYVHHLNSLWDSLVSTYNNVLVDLTSEVELEGNEKKEEVPEVEDVVVQYISEDNLLETLNVISNQKTSVKDRQNAKQTLLKGLANNSLEILVSEKIVVEGENDTLEMNSKPIKVHFSEYLGLLESLELGDVIEIENISYDEAGAINYLKLIEIRNI